MKGQKETTKISDRVKNSQPISGLELYTVKTSLKNVFNLRGSFLAGSYFSKNPLTPVFIARLLDEGTSSLPKEILRQRIESLGAEISFSSNTFRINFSIAGMSKDIDKLLTLFSKMLKGPLFPQKSIEVIREQIITELEQSKENTSAEAQRLLQKELYNVKHPNYSYSADELIEFAKKIKKEDIISFYKESFGLSSFIIAAVGDVNHANIEKNLMKLLSSWQKSTLVMPVVSETAKKKYMMEKSKYIADKENVDVIFGQPIFLKSTDFDYYPLRMARFILGGSFSSRLVHYVREQKGLTYHIRAFSKGVTPFYDGHVGINANFSPKLLEEGIKATKEVLRLFYEKGVTPKELTNKKIASRGISVVSFEKSSALANVILSNAEDGQSKEFLDEDLERIEQVTLKEVNAAIKKYFNPAKFSLIYAGSFLKK